MALTLAEQIADVIGGTPEEAAELVRRLGMAGLQVTAKSITEGRGVYSYLDADKLAVCDRVGPTLGLLQARCEAAAKVALNPIAWHVRPERRTEVDGPLGGWIAVCATERDLDPLAWTALASGSMVAVLKVSAQSHPYYWIAGWAWDIEIFEAPHHRVEIEDLRPFRTLHEEVKKWSYYDDT